jgi:hypothetical protein
LVSLLFGPNKTILFVRTGLNMNGVAYEYYQDSLVGIEPCGKLHYRWKSWKESSDYYQSDLLCIKKVYWSYYANDKRIGWQYQPKKRNTTECRYQRSIRSVTLWILKLNSFGQSEPLWKFVFWRKDEGTWFTQFWNWIEVTFEVTDIDFEIDFWTYYLSFVK